MDYCPATFPFKDATKANKQPVIHAMIITQFTSANFVMSLLLSTNANSDTGTDHRCAGLSACGVNGSSFDDNGTLCFFAAHCE